MVLVAQQLQELAHEARLVGGAFVVCDSTSKTTGLIHVIVVAGHAEAAAVHEAAQLTADVHAASSSGEVFGALGALALERLAHRRQTLHSRELHRLGRVELGADQIDERGDGGGVLVLIHGSYATRTRPMMQRAS